jgi:hypothetical protein
MEQFKDGQKVKTNFGNIETVCRQNGNMVFTYVSINSWYHPNNLTKLS